MPREAKPVTATTRTVEARSRAGLSLATIGQTTVFDHEMGSADGGTRFMIETPGEIAGQTLIDDAAEHLGDNGFRMVGSKARMGRLTVDAVRSMRVQGRVGRVACRETSYALVFGDGNEVHWVTSFATGDPDTLLLARRGDQVTLWYDVIDGQAHRVTSFVNDELPTLR
jgi:hypothetical protein